MVQITHVFIVAAAVIAPVLAVPFEFEDEYYPRDFVELEARDPLNFRGAVNWARRTYQQARPLIQAAARVFNREYDEDDLFAREFDDDELDAREFDDDELDAREFEDELYAREFEDELDAREPENTLLYDDLD